MIVLDTDHLSLLEWQDHPWAMQITARLRELAPQQLPTTTIITYEEQIRGWMARLAKARDLADQVAAYARLFRQVESYRRLDVLPFDDVAAVHYQRLRSLRLRVGTMDLKIAAIALAHDATLLSRNLADFGKVPGLKVHDATR